MKPLMILLATGIALLPDGSLGREVQSHGLMFEQWLRETFFRGYEPQSPTQKWDVPAEANKDHGHLPVNPKATKHGTPINLGDALRQFEIDEAFLLIVGFWQQVTAEEKRWRNVQTVTVTPEMWRKLWGPITKSDLERLNAVIKDKTLSIEETRVRAQGIKSKPPFTSAVIQVNPKIDASQRRLQCSLRFDDFFKHLAPEASSEPQVRPMVFGVPVPPRFESSPRKISPP
ncbi:hypothetical protein [Prosthecobacter sp.]|uniref:hypothetical protein n=1 Tax=Prosthecobacter sp. TaxID=1965333 RepID=UPI001D545DBB|nr:hypothetical protein [Prosthecobacter sp.]MCB1275344.1 hypothetical protein [Prosthecobacter sp.]